MKSPHSQIALSHSQIISGLTIRTAGGRTVEACMKLQSPLDLGIRHGQAALIALGVPPQLARTTAGSGHGPWYLARSKALSIGLSNAYFKSLGLPSLVDEG